MTKFQLFILWVFCVIATTILLPVQLFQALFGSGKRSFNMAIGIDQTANAMFDGSPDETISSRAYGCNWQRTEKLINWLFGDNEHCKKAFEFKNKPKAKRKK